METIASTEFLCARCATLSKTCCWDREIYVSPADARRITAFSKRNDFVEWCTPVDPEYLDQSDDPIWALHVFRKDGKRRILRRTASGGCTFLGDAGCVLPETVRPIVCRLFPFTYTADGLDAEPAPGCPKHLLPEGVSVFGALNMNTEQAMMWHQMLYEEILADNDTDNDDRPDI